MITSKPTNPKDVIGSGKLPVGLVPDTISAEVALAYLEGALKYGRANWRMAGVRASVYNDALERHRMKWWNGENADRKTRVKHLASIIACAGIVLDAELCGMLTDDRPPSAPISDLIDSADERVAYLKELFKDFNPQQFSIADRDLSHYVPAGTQNPFDTIPRAYGGNGQFEARYDHVQHVQVGHVSLQTKGDSEHTKVDLSPKRQTPLHQRRPGVGNECECGDPKCDYFGSFPRSLPPENV